MGKGFAGRLLVGLVMRSLMPVAAGSERVRLHEQAIREAIGRALPPPGTGRAAGLPATVVIANFNEDSADCAERAWGWAVGATLRVESWGRSPALSFSTPTGYALDARAAPGEPRGGAGLRVARRTGARWLVQGEVREHESGLRIGYVVRDLAGGDPARFNQETTVDEAGVALADAIPAILALMDAPLDEAERRRLARLREVPSTGLAALQEAARADCEGDGWAEAMQRAWRRVPEFAAVAAHGAAELTWNQSADAALEQLEAARSQADGHPVVRLVSAYDLAFSTPREQRAEALADLRSLARRYPQESAALRALADVLAARARDAGEGSGGNAIDESAEAIAVSLYALRLAPEDYRNWWSLANAVGEYSGAIRGTGYWSQVPEDARRRVLQLAPEIDYALDRALELHPAALGLFRLKIDADARNSRDWTEIFRAAAEVAPRDRGLYNSALHYAKDQWGGDWRKRVMVYRLARRNNPGADWPARDYLAHQPGLESTFFVYWPYLVLALVLPVVALVLLNRRRSGGDDR